MLVAVNFHYIKENYNYPFKAIFGTNPVEFRKQLEALSKEGEFVSQQDLLKSIKGEYTLPDKSILITFDDGLREQYELALPILTEMGIPAIFFINPMNSYEKKISTVHQIHLLRSFISPQNLLKRISVFDIDLSPAERLLAFQHYNYDQEEGAILKYFLNFKLDLNLKDFVINQLFVDFFSSSEIEAFHKAYYMDLNILLDLDQLGYLGSHTYSHQPLGLLSPENLQQEFEKSDLFFQNEGIAPPKSVSYPYGSFESCSRAVQEMAKKFDFHIGLTMERAANLTVTDHPLCLARFDCNDVVGGKFNLFRSGSMFQEMSLKSWNF